MEGTSDRKSGPQSPKIKIFQIIQKNLASIGIGPNSEMKLHPINAKTLLISLMLTLATISIVIYISKGANTFAEFTQSAYTCSVLVLMSFVLIIMIAQLEELFKIINDCECLANISQFLKKTISEHKPFLRVFKYISVLKYSASKSIFFETNQSVEKLSKILFLVIVKMTPASCLLPWFIYSFFIYFTTDLGADVFILQSPMW